MTPPTKFAHHAQQNYMLRRSEFEFLGNYAPRRQGEQTAYDEPETVLLHPWQLRAVCEQFGIIASNQQAAKTIAALTRRLLVLRDRIDELAADLSNHSDHKHADLSYEITYANATADIAAEFVAELEAVQPCTKATEQTPERVKPTTSTSPRQLSIDTCN